MTWGEVLGCAGESPGRHVMLMSCVSILQAVIGVVVLLMLTSLAGKVLGNVHLHLITLVGLAAIEHGMLALMMGLTEHAKGRGICAWASVRGGGISETEAYSSASNRRACPLQSLSGVVRLLLVLWLVVIRSGP